MDLISIIIPVYNVEPYLAKCLNSVINQTHTNLEILLINDGSTDKSGLICDEYAKKDNRIKVFHKINEGSSSARNAGLKNFTGKYIGFVDSDDWIEPDMYEVLYNAIKQNPVSISVANFYKETESSTILCYNAKKIPDGILSLRDILYYIYRLDNYNGFHIVIWNKLYDANLFLSNRQLLFNESIKGCGDDVLFLPEVFILGNCTAVYINSPVYHYLQRSSSYVHSGTVTEKENGSLLAHKMVLELFDKHRYSDLNVLVRKEICYYASLIAELAIKTGDSDALKRMQKTIDENLPYYIEIQGSYPERVERIKSLLNYKLVI